MLNGREAAAWSAGDISAAAAAAAATGDTATDAMKSLRSTGNLRAEPTGPARKCPIDFAYGAVSAINCAYTATVRVAVIPPATSPLVVASSSDEPSRNTPSVASVTCAALRA